MRLLATIQGILGEMAGAIREGLLVLSIGLGPGGADDGSNRSPDGGGSRGKSKTMIGKTSDGGSPAASCLCNPQPRSATRLTGRRHHTPL